MLVVAELAGQWQWAGGLGLGGEGFRDPDQEAFLYFGLQHWRHTTPLKHFILVTPHGLTLGELQPGLIGI